MTYANNLDRIEAIRSDGRIDGADPSIAALTGRTGLRCMTITQDHDPAKGYAITRCLVNVRV